jgi:hypothetical protein
MRKRKGLGERWRSVPISRKMDLISATRQSQNDDDLDIVK